MRYHTSLSEVIEKQLIQHEKFTNNILMNIASATWILTPDYYSPLRTTSIPTTGCLRRHWDQSTVQPISSYLWKTSQAVRSTCSILCLSRWRSGSWWRSVSCQLWTASGYSSSHPSVAQSLWSGLRRSWDDEWFCYSLTVLVSTVGLIFVVEGDPRKFQPKENFCVYM